MLGYPNIIIYTSIVKVNNIASLRIIYLVLNTKKTLKIQITHKYIINSAHKTEYSETHT